MSTDTPSGWFPFLPKRSIKLQNDNSFANTQQTPCRFFKSGTCIAGAQCRYSHQVLTPFGQDRDGFISFSVPKSQPERIPSHNSSASSSDDDKESTSLPQSAESHGKIIASLTRESTKTLTTVSSPATGATVGASVTANGPVNAQNCKFFALGSCRNGSQCSFSHSGVRVAGSLGIDPLNKPALVGFHHSILPSVRDIFARARSTQNQTHHHAQQRQNQKQPQSNQPSNPSYSASDSSATSSVVSSPSSSPRLVSLSQSKPVSFSSENKQSHHNDGSLCELHTGNIIYSSSGSSFSSQNLEPITPSSSPKMSAKPSLIGGENMPKLIFANHRPTPTDPIERLASITPTICSNPLATLGPVSAAQISNNSATSISTLTSNLRSVSGGTLVHYNATISLLHDPPSPRGETKASHIVISTDNKLAPDFLESHVHRVTESILTPCQDAQIPKDISNVPPRPLSPNEEPMNSIMDAIQDSLSFEPSSHSEQDHVHVQVRPSPLANVDVNSVVEWASQSNFLTPTPTKKSRFSFATDDEDDDGTYILVSPSSTLGSDFAKQVDSPYSEPRTNEQKIQPFSLFDFNEEKLQSRMDFSWTEAIPPATRSNSPFTSLNPIQHDVANDQPKQTAVGDSDIQDDISAGSFLNYPGGQPMDFCVKSGGITEAINVPSSPSTHPHYSSVPSTPISYMSALGAEEESMFAFHPPWLPKSSSMIEQESHTQSQDYGAVWENQMEDLISDVSKEEEVTDATKTLCIFYINGNCRFGSSCRNIHGDVCDTCHKPLLYPNRPELNKVHQQECYERFVTKQERYFTRESKCCICHQRPFDLRRKFGLMNNCNHPFCLDCIRDHRGRSDSTGYSAKACPVCGVDSQFVVPSDRFVQNPSRKERYIESYRSKLSAIPCRYYESDQACPFGASCFYAHRMKISSDEEEKHNRKYINGDGQVDTIRRVQISDFMVAPAQPKGVKAADSKRL
eukprot:TRINITY_DN3412_c0_g1_i1.p1 TRINITY_DN3412_c0_g1~~TRINITY_DN3412_c0_g1_i1.p1  ORF type:complete len:968 (+),score=164.65 TRINITY_DN3412_c0_g1_i1:99-3002(+)